MIRKHHIAHHLQKININIPPHNNQLPRILRERRIEPCRKRNVRQRPRRINRHLPRILPHHVHHERRGGDVAVDSSAGESLDEGLAHDAVGVAGGGVGAVVGFCGAVLGRECALPGEFAVQAFPGVESVGGVQEGPGCAFVDGDAA